MNKGLGYPWAIIELSLRYRYNILYDSSSIAQG